MIHRHIAPIFALAASLSACADPATPEGPPPAGALDRGVDEVAPADEARVAAEGGAAAPEPSARPGGSAADEGAPAGGGQDAVDHYFCNYLYSFLPRVDCNWFKMCAPGRGTMTIVTTSVYWCCEFEVCGEQYVTQTTEQGCCG
jgi:hypothetical protein